MKKRFIFDENYIKKHAKKNKLKTLIIIGGVLVIVLIIIIIILASINKKPKNPEPKPSDSIVYEFKDEVIVEAGSPLPDVGDYFKKIQNIDLKSIKAEYPADLEINYNTSSCSESEIEKINAGEDIEKFDCVKKTLDTPATYGVTIIINDKETTVKLTVKDTHEPSLSLKDVEIYEGNSYTSEEFVNYCLDASNTCTVSFYDKDVGEDGKNIDYSKYQSAGTYKVKLYAKDNYGNTTKPMEANLVIKKIETTMHTVTFNSNGGSAINKVEVEDGRTIKEPNTPTRSGYTFAGWYLNDTKFDFTAGINSDITLTARWNKIGGSNPPGVVGIKSISLNYKKINLYVNESKTVKATINPSNTTDKNITWTSADNSIATVVNGKITGHKAGTVKITATSGGKSASLEVVVKNKSTCAFGDANYNNSYILSVKLVNNNCAVNPNGNYLAVDDAVIKEYNKAIKDIGNMGFSTGKDDFSHKVSYVKVKNTAGTGLVGVQITMTITVKDNYALRNATYIIKPDGTRQMLSNTIEKNGVKFK